MGEGVFFPQKYHRESGSGQEESGRLDEEAQKHKYRAEGFESRPEKYRAFFIRFGYLHIQKIPVSRPEQVNRQKEPEYCRYEEAVIIEAWKNA